MLRSNAGAGGSTRELTWAASQGDPEAWETLVERYRGVVWSTVRSYRLGDADTHDAVQNTWLRMVEHLGSVRDSDRLGGWLATIAGRECLKLIRRRGREVAGLESALLDRPDEGAPEPERFTIDRTMRDLLWRHVGQLPPQGRDMLVALTASDAPRYADFAGSTGIPVGSIGPTRMRYLRKLRRRLEACGLGAQAWW